MAIINVNYKFVTLLENSGKYGLQLKHNYIYLILIIILGSFQTCWLSLILREKKNPKSEVIEKLSTNKDRSIKFYPVLSYSLGS